MQRSEFTFKGVCSFILYRAMEESRTASNGIYESNQQDAKDCERVDIILEKIVKEGRITGVIGNVDSFTDNTQFIKINN